MNLAFLKYTPLLRRGNGIIDRVELYRPPEDAKKMVAYAYLHPSISKDWSVYHEVYGSADGTGTATKRATAIYIAISEALERWAFFSQKNTVPTPNHILLDGTSSGFAAFPSLMGKEARLRSSYEAIERSALILFSKGKLKLYDSILSDNENIFYFGLSSKINMKTESIRSAYLAIISARSPQNGFYYFGFAARKNASLALEQARHEADRNRSMISQFLDKHQFTVNDIQDLITTGNDFKFYHTEKRLLFFATPKGKLIFDQAIEMSKSAPAVGGATIDEILSLPILGPWSKYTTVWRTLCSPIADVSEIGSNGDVFIF